MTVRNIKQYAASVNKLVKDEIKHEDLATIVENGKPVIVTTEHDELVIVAAELRKLASKLLNDERDFVNKEVVERVTKDQDLMAVYARKLQQKDTLSATPVAPVQPEVERHDTFNHRDDETLF